MSRKVDPSTEQGASLWYRLHPRVSGFGDAQVSSGETGGRRGVRGFICCVFASMVESVVLSGPCHSLLISPRRVFPPRLGSYLPLTCPLLRLRLPFSPDLKKTSELFIFHLSLCKILGFLVTFQLMIGIISLHFYVHRNI